MKRIIIRRIVGDKGVEAYDKILFISNISLFILCYILIESISFYCIEPTSLLGCTVPSIIGIIEIVGVIVLTSKLSEGQLRRRGYIPYLSYYSKKEIVLELLEKHIHMQQKIMIGFRRYTCKELMEWQRKDMMKLLRRRSQERNGK